MHIIHRAGEAGFVIFAMVLLSAPLMGGHARAATPAPTGRLLVPPLEARSGAPARLAHVLSDYIITEAKRVPGHSVMSSSDVEQLLSAESRKQLVGCTETSCLAEIANALAADEVLHGAVGRLGDRELVLTLNRVSTQSARTHGAESQRLPLDSTDAMLDGASQLLKRLYPDYELPAPRVTGMAPWKVGGAMTAIGGVLQYSAVTSALFSTLAMAMCGVCQGMVVVAPMVTACVASPMAIAWLQAWMADLLGRRQVGFRKAGCLGSTLVGVATCLDTPLVLANVINCSTLGLVFGVLAGYFGLAGVSGTESVTTISGATTMGTLYMLICGAQGFILALLPALLTSLLIAPAAQTLLLMKTSQPRPPGEEAAVSGLYAPDENPPAFLRFLPGNLVGGRPAPDDELDALESAP